MKSMYLLYYILIYCHFVCLHTYSHTYGDSKVFAPLFGYVESLHQPPYNSAVYRNSYIGGTLILTHVILRYIPEIVLLL